METGADSRSAGDGRSLAPCRIQNVLGLLSRHRTHPRRKCIGVELRQRIFRMAAENPTWGTPRTHGELTVLGFDVSERTVLRWIRKAPRSPEPAKR